jgi:septum formation protein
MRGRSGILHTGHGLMGPRQVTLSTVSTVVRFADVTDEEIALYCATGEPASVAGGFTIDGLGGWFIEGIEGDPHNVVGVSLPILRAMLREQGFELADLGYVARL